MPLRTDHLYRSPVSCLSVQCRQVQDCLGIVVDAGKTTACRVTLRAIEAFVQGPIETCQFDLHTHILKSDLHVHNAAIVFDM
jgi:hypothetical protein